jgi:nitrite reductase/ring-hydroxylating ferredoxin subunit/uncharacterized membrane protein
MQSAPKLQIHAIHGYKAAMNAEITSTGRIVDRLSRSPALDALADTIQPTVHDLLEGDGSLKRPLNDALHGRWLGHALHPIMTDIPIGAWTVAAVCDALVLIGNDDYRATAHTATTIGAVGAVGAAVTGWADWSDTKDEPKRLGMLHALVNSTALSVYVASLVARSANKPRAGSWLGLLGYGIMTAGAYLGGELALGMNIGAKHTSVPIDPPTTFTPVFPADDLAEGEMKRIEVGGLPLLFTRSNNTIYAVSAVCTHRGAPLEEGKRDGDCITCPWHGSRFSLLDGTLDAGPATFPLARFETRVDDGMLEVRALPV